MNQQDGQKRKGSRVEKTKKNGIVIETTYDDEGNVVGVKKWVKPDERQQGPVPNVEQRPQ